MKIYHLNDYPLAVLIVSALIMYSSAWWGVQLQAKLKQLRHEERPDFDLLRTAAFTLLALLVGFCLSMVVTRYDHRKLLEETEANAIGTEYARADLLEERFRVVVREKLKAYTAHRIEFYESRLQDSTAAFEAMDAKQHAELWASVVAAAQSRNDPVMALVVSGMNDVINSQGFTQAAWRNRLPSEAWSLMFIVAVLANLLMGFGANRPRKLHLCVLPLMISVSLFLIADVDSPGLGLVKIVPENLVSLQRTM